jgi:hypothetical protein
VTVSKDGRFRLGAQFTGEERVKSLINGSSAFPGGAHKGEWKKA